MSETHLPRQVLQCLNPDLPSTQVEPLNWVKHLNHLQFRQISPLLAHHETSALLLQRHRLVRVDLRAADLLLARQQAQLPVLHPGLVEQAKYEHDSDRASTTSPALGLVPLGRV